MVVQLLLLYPTIVEGMVPQYEPVQLSREMRWSDVEDDDELRYFRTACR